MGISIEDKSNNKMEILWKRTEEGARIERVFGQDMSVKLPAYIEGNPVTEVGAYCFSSMDKFSFSDAFLTAIGEEEVRISEAHFPQIEGKYVEEVILPDSVTMLGNGAFYNCRNMKHISMSVALNRFGSDVFRNCLRLDSVTLRGYSEDKSCLSKILERVKTEVEVCFQPEENRIDCRLFFPECNEWFDDMVTAHVWGRVVVGEGYRMRQCFHDHRIQFSKYDRCFSDSIKLEGDHELCKIALNRLRWPVNLKEEYRSIYEKALEDRYDILLPIIISHKDIDALQFICQNLKPEQSYLTRWMEACIRAEWIEGNVYLMKEKYSGSTFADKSYDFDL